MMENLNLPLSFVLFFFFLLLSSPTCTQDLPSSSSSAFPPTRNITEICTTHNNRPSFSERLFVSPFIDALVEETCLRMTDPDLALLFIDCFPNTLDTTVQKASSEDTFIITGDITAMWQRDSAWQVHPYIPFASEDRHLANMLRGLVKRQIKSVLLDPYANAFNQNNSGNGWQSDERTPAMTPGVFEGKWEVDSLCSVIQTSYGLWKELDQDPAILDSNWVAAMHLILDTFEYQQLTTEHVIDSGSPKYSFQRETTAPTDTLMHGIGTPAQYTGMIRSAFRASDDATTMQFNIGENAFAVVSLRKMSEMLHAVGKDLEATRASTIAEEIEEGIQEYGIVNGKSGPHYAYEVDGYGSSYFMDDANIPSLLSLPFLDYCEMDDEKYQTTRKMVLSGRNPFFSRGTAGEGVGGPHIGQGWIWPMSIIVRALTTDDVNEIQDCLNLLKTSSVNTGFMHESFWKNDATQYTRPWFAWANTMFGHLILHLAETHPELVF